jgi:UDP-N-acetylglucosamine diphosphorylase / glucose-1-phosphate thymidylyltransferase / UDP-N-acetylgalactosamine diphosphorylase / glucosamine-1-phosphate N-acetyltransferase / galactosamine-1-phosphate N-acetyltransferase
VSNRIERAVVMAAGEGTRLRPITERYPKPVLPIDGRPVVVTVLNDLHGAGIDEIVVVTGHLAEQVEALLDGHPAAPRFVRQPEALGSADAVRRAALEPPYLVVGADTQFARGAVAAFGEQALAYDNAVAVRPRADAPPANRVRVADGLVTRFGNDDPADLTTGAPLWLVGATSHRHLNGVPGPPYELKEALERARSEGATIGAIPVGPTRDLTDPFDLIEENFGYLRG